MFYKQLCDKKKERAEKKVKSLWKHTVIILTLTLFMVFGGSLTVKAAESGTIGTPDAEGKVLSWSYDEGRQTLTVTGEGELGIALRQEPFASMEIKKIQFQGCKVVGSMRAAFRDMADLEEIDFSGLNTGNVTNMSEMFSGCSGLSELDVSNFDTGSVTDMNWMFYECSGLSELDVSNFDTGSVTDIRSMFSGCSGLSELDVSNFDTSNVTSMYFMFAGCSGLSELDVSNFDTGNVTSMRNMFSNCSGLSELDVSNFATGNVTDMHGMFKDCSGLSKLDVSNFATGSVTDMSWMFYGCSSLSELDVSSFDMGSVTIMDDMFSNCNISTLQTPHTIAEGCSSSLPATFYNADLYESTGEYHTTDVLDASFAGITLKKYEEPAGQFPDAVLYVPYDYAFPGHGGQGAAGCSLADGELPAGMELNADGTLQGIPMDIGEFVFTIKETVSGSEGGGEVRTTCALVVQDNSDVNAEAATDEGYEIIQRVPNFTGDELSDYTLVSVGAYSEFREVYIDGVKLTEGTDYSSEEGSTRITIFSETFARFQQVGLHTIAVEFRTTQSNEMKLAVQNYWVTDNDSNDATEGANGSNSSLNGNGGAGTAIWYTVVKGDTLNKIARKHNTGLVQLLVWNPQIKNANRISVGQRLIVGYVRDGGAAGMNTADREQVQAEGAVYDEVRKGDSFYRIARRNSVELNMVIYLNPKIARQKYIYCGQKIRVK